MPRPEDIEVDVREMPYVRQIAEFMCDDPGDSEQLQRNLWRIDAMATADVQVLFLAMRAGVEARP